MRIALLVTAFMVLNLISACSQDSGTPVSPVPSPSPVPSSSPVAGTGADQILLNGKILTVDAQFTIAEAIAIAGERILAVGSNEAIQALAGPATRIRDLEGRTVVPGLIDNHNHFVRATEQWYRQVRWDEVDTRREALNKLRQKAAQLPPGEWIVVLGGWIFEQFSDDQHAFSRQELDQVLPANPVYIQLGYSRGYANSLALAATGIDAATRVADGTLVRDDAGELSGELIGAGAFLRLAARIPATSDATWDQSLQLTVDDYLKAGLTTLLDVGGNTVTPRHYEALDRAAANGLLNLRVFYTLNAQNVVGASPEDIIEALETWAPRSGNDRFGQFTYGEMTYQGIADPAGVDWNPDQASLDNYGNILKTAARRGWQIHEHSNRDDKMQAILGLMAEVNRESPIAGLRWTIAHAETASDQTIAQAAALGVLFALHSSAQMGAVAAAQGGEDVSRVPPIRQIEASGIIWGLGSDGTVVSGHHPFHDLGWAVSGLARNGEKLLQATVSREAALRAHTINNAYLLFMEDRLGSLEAGKYADLVVLDSDYMSVPEARIRDIHPVMTMVNGQLVFEQ
ncbi:MAG: amidohydrolase family protein [Pseudomonadales bacterium]|nr:amidohydrolase family protein [Pseudomonadales bacterium]